MADQDAITQAWQQQQLEQKALTEQWLASKGGTAEPAKTATPAPIVPPIRQSPEELRTAQQPVETTAPVQPTDEELTAEFEEAQRIAAEEEALRERQAARPQSDNLVENLTTMVTDPEETGKRSALDLTIDTAGIVLDPLDAILNTGLGAIGIERGKTTDYLKDKVRTTEAGFKTEEGARRVGRELAMIPAIPSALAGFGATLVDAALTDDTLGEAMFTDEGMELYTRAQAGDEIAAAQLNEDVGEYLKPGLGFVNDVAQFADEVSGVAQREGGRVPLDEEVYGIIGSMFVGLPVAVPRTLSMKLVDQFGPRAVEVATKMATSKGGKVALRTAEALTPVTVPFADNAAGYLGAVGVNAAAGVGINDIMRAMNDEDTAVGALTSTAQDVGPAAAATSVLGAAGVVAAWRRPGRLRGFITGDAPAPNTTGALPANSLEQMEADVFDADRPAIRAMEMVFGKESEEVATVMDSLRLNTRQGGSVRIDAAWNEGIAPSGPGARYTHPGKVIVEAADNLTHAQRKVAAEGLLADDILWTMAQPNRKNPSQWSEAQLKSMSARLKQNMAKVPELRQVINAYRTHTKELLEEAHKAGMFTKEQMVEMRARPYVPNVPFGKEETSVYQSLFSGRQRFANEAQSPFAEFREGKTQDFTDPFDALGISEKSMTQVMLENRTRKNYIRKLMSGMKGMDKDKLQEMFPNGVPIRRAGKGETGQTVTVWDKGKQEAFVVGDPQLRNALQFAPHSSLQMLAVTRRMYQSGTTGEFNPMFAPTSLGLDTFFSSFNVRRDQVGGYIDAAMHRYTPGLRDSVVGDALTAAVRPLDVAVAAGVGVGRSAIDRMTGEIANQMAKWLSKSGLLDDIGEQGVQGLAQMMTNRWHKSASYEMQRHGYAPGAYSADIGDMQPGRFDALLRALFEDNLLGRSYRGALNSIRDGWRTQFFTLNRAKLLAQDSNYQTVLKTAKGIGYNPFDAKILDSKKTPAMKKIDKQVEDAAYNANKRAARMAREIGSDPTRGGQSQRVNEMVGAMPYSNVGVQSMHAFYKNLKDNPMSRWTALSFGAWGVGTTAMVVESGGGEWWFEKVPDNVRARTMPINPSHMLAKARGEEYVFDPKDVILVDVGPEMAAVKSAVAGGMEYLTGLPHQAQWRDNAWQQRYVELGNTIMDLIPFGTPPALNVGTSVAGLGPINFDRMSDNRGLFDNAMSGGGMGNEDTRFRGADDNGPLMTDKVANTLSSLFGAAMSTITDGIEEVEASMELNGTGIVEGINDALEVKSFKVTEKQIPRIWNRAQSPSRSAPVISEAYEIRRLMEPLSDQMQIEMNGAVGDDPVLRTWPSRLADRLNSDPANMPLVQIMSQLETVWNADPVIGDAYTELSKLKSKYDDVEADRRQSPLQMQENLDQIILDMHDASEIIVTRTAAIEELMGEGFDFKDYMQQVGDALRKTPPQVN